MTESVVGVVSPIFAIDAACLRSEFGIALVAIDMPRKDMTSHNDQVCFFFVFADC